MYGTLYLGVNAGICADGGIKIYVLDNDEDEDGNQLEITDVGTPTSNDDGSVNGIAIAEDDDGDGVDDFISYTPSNSPDTVTFEYTISDGNGGTDTAEVTVDVTGDESSCGPLTVRVEDQDENLVNATFTPMYDTKSTPDGTLQQLPAKSGEWTYNVEVTDKPRLSEMNGGLLDIPDGFATSVDEVKKKLEKTLGQEEPDDFRYPFEDANDKKSKLATDPSGGDGGGDDDTNTCTKTVSPDDWTGQTDSSSIESDGDDDYYEDYESSDGQVTATLDITDYVGSGETLQSVEVGYGGSVDCDSQADSCTANASTEVSFNTGKSKSGSVSADLSTNNDSYSGTLTTTDENTQTIEATNDSSVSIQRKEPSGPDVKATAAAAVGGTKITVETTKSCGDTGGGGGNTGNTAPEVFHIYPEYTGGANDKITLVGLAADVDADPLTYDWYQGTDTTGTPDGSGKTYNLGDQSCSYSQDWTLQVSDGELTGIVTRTIEGSNDCGGGGGGGGGPDPALE